MWDGQSERLEALAAPPCDVGAPVPHVFSNEEATVLAYAVNDPSFGSLTAPRSASDRDVWPWAIVTIRGCSNLRFGEPGDETIHGHRLARLGLRSYAAYEVRFSSWIAEMEVANRVHANHSPSLFRDRRHFVFTFHDSMVEFVARGLEIEIKEGRAIPLVTAAFQRAASEH